MLLLRYYCWCCFFMLLSLFVDDAAMPSMLARCFRFSPFRYAAIAFHADIFTSRYAMPLRRRRHYAAAARHSAACRYVDAIFRAFHAAASFSRFVIVTILLLFSFSPPLFSLCCHAAYLLILRHYWCYSCCALLHLPAFIDALFQLRH